MNTQKIKEALEEAIHVIEVLKPDNYGMGTIVRCRDALAALSMPQEAVAWQNTGDPQWIKVGGSAPDDENWTALVYASPLPQAAQPVDWKQHIHLQPVACEDEPDAHNVIFKVGVQSFVIGCVAQESKEHAEWFAGQFVKALENACALSSNPSAGRDGERQLEIGKAVERACRELPDGYDLHIELENGAGIVRLYLPDTDAEMSDFDADTFGGEINKAIDAAIAKDEP